MCITLKKKAKRGCKSNDTKKRQQTKKAKHTSNIIQVESSTNNMTGSQETESLAEQQQFISLLEKRIQLENKLCDVILKRKQIEKEKIED